VGLLLQTQKIGRQRSNRKKRRGKKRPSKKEKKTKEEEISSLSFYLCVCKNIRARAKTKRMIIAINALTLIPSLDLTTKQVPRNLDRPVLRRSVCVVHVPAHRERRHQPARHGVDESAHGRYFGQTPCLERIELPFDANVGFILERARRHRDF